MQSFSQSKIKIVALLAVLLWSLKPIFITIIGTSIEFSETYLLAGSFAVIGSLLICIPLRKYLVNVIKAKSWEGILYAILAGVFLGLWYYGFYRALYFSNKSDATIIAFTWPLISIIAMRIFNNKITDKLHWKQWLLILISFIGAGLIAMTESNEQDNNEIIWAFIAALGSGLYLPFAIKANNIFNKIIQKSTISTFFTISFANITSLLLVSITLLITNYHFHYNQINLKIITICAIIGLGTYLLAEVAWTWAFQSYKSLTLSSLPYFSPAISVLLLFILFSQPITTISIIGLIIILISNLLLHFMKDKLTN